MTASIFRRHLPQQGAPPGSFAVPEVHVEPRMHVISYDADELVENDVTGVEELPGILREGGVNWIDVQGLGDGSVVRELGELKNLHPLALSDVVNLGQRPKVDEYDDVLFFALRMVQITGEGRLAWEQISIFLGPGFVLSFQETHGDCLDPLRDRIRGGRKRIRSAGNDFLACMIVDTTVDGYFPVLEHHGDRLEEFEEIILDRPTRRVLGELYRVKRDLVTFRRSTWPLRDALQHLLRDESDALSPDALFYLRDTVDHVMQVVDVSETHRDLSAGLVDVYLSTVGQKTNEVMKVLTVIATVFIPLTFVAGIYGMNFDTQHPGNLPELGWKYGYLFFWGLCGLLVVVLLGVFRRLGWLGGGVRD